MVQSLNAFLKTQVFTNFLNTYNGDGNPISIGTLHYKFQVYTTIPPTGGGLLGWYLYQQTLRGQILFGASGPINIQLPSHRGLCMLLQVPEIILRNKLVVTAASEMLVLHNHIRRFL